MAKQSGKRLTLTVLLGLIAVLGIMALYAVYRPLSAIAGVPVALDSTPVAPVNLSWPPYGQSAIGAVGYGVLATNGPQAPMATASIAKILTALTVLQRKPLKAGEQGPNITIGTADIDSYNSFAAQDGSVIPVNDGETLSEYQALQALLLPSANNIAETLARWSYGSLDAFTAAANAYASQLGLTSFHMTDPSGFAATTVASASDLTTLGLTAIQQPVIADIVKQPSAVIPVAGTIYNVNALLGSDGTIGIKTGNNDADPGAYLFASQQMVSGKTLTIVGTVMGGPGLRQVLDDSLPLIASAAQSFSLRTIVDTGQTVGRYAIPWQGTIDAVSDSSVPLVQWQNAKTPTTVSLQALPIGTSAGSTVGVITVHDQSKPLNVAVHLAQPIKKPPLSWRLKHPF